MDDLRHESRVLVLVLVLFDLARMVGYQSI